MPILQNIQIAEQEAETLRQNAHKEVEDLLESTKQKALTKAKQIMEASKIEVEKKNQETINLINKLEAENLENIKREKEALEELAKLKKEVGVNYILKQVVEI